MNVFEQELKKNNFVCSFCPKCDKFVWPVSELCNSCFGKVTWKKVDKSATLVEFSQINGEIFCIAEFEGQIRLMGKLLHNKNLKVGQSLTLVKCDYGENEIFVLDANI